VRNWRVQKQNFGIKRGRDNRGANGTGGNRKGANRRHEDWSRRSCREDWYKLSKRKRK
jgi:hypothetical protein